MTLASRYPTIALTAMMMLTGCGPAPAPENPEQTSGPEEPPPQTSTPSPHSKPLDLSMDQDTLFELDANNDEIDTSQRADLPSLVGPAAEKRLRVSPGVITNEEAVGLRDRVDGGEVSIELKTK
ncbi:MAG: hypothetical protein NXH85_11760 [Pseudomonadaceae bacterium]|nr:hypothetical protein [Pseudomonadaceae bacterium]